MAAAKKTPAKKKSNSISVNFEGVEVSRKIEPGCYLAAVDSVELKESDAGNEYLNWKLSLQGSGTVYYVTSLLPQSLFNLRAFLEAGGVEVEETEMELDLDEYVGMELGVEVDNEVYQGKKRARVVDVFPADEVEASEEESDEPEEEKKPTTSSKKSKPKEEPTEDEFGEGQAVSFKDGKKTFHGTIIGPAEEEGVYVVDVDGEEWEISGEDLTLIEEEPEEKKPATRRKK